MLYRAKSLKDIATHFDRLAENERKQAAVALNAAKRKQHEATMHAYWTARDILLQTEIVPE